MGKFRIANNLIEIIHPEIPKIEDVLPSMAPFKISTETEDDAILKIQGVPYKGLEDIKIERALTKKSNGLGSWTLYETGEGFCIDLVFEEGFPTHRMTCNKTFSDCKIAILLGEPNGIYVLDAFIMMAYSQCCALYQTAMLHASVVRKGSKGYAFLGSSGTGKSTHSQLWLNNIPETELINDDNPAIRLMPDGTVHVFGTPWSGKTNCYKNIDTELGGFVLLKQAQENKIASVSPLHAYLTLIGSSSTLRWNNDLFNALGKTLEYAANHIPFLLLENKPVPEAAQLCYNRLAKEQ